MQDYKFIHIIPYKYILNSGFDYSNEKEYDTFLQNKNEIYTEFINYSKRDTVDTLYKDLEDIIEKIDKLGLERLDLLLMLLSRVSDKHGLDNNESVRDTDKPNFYQWIVAISTLLNIQINENVSIIQAIELEKIALSKIKNETV